MLKSAVALTDGQLLDDYELLVQGHALYHPNFFGKSDDFQILKDLAAEVRRGLFPVRSNTILERAW
jgi:hypothetical protein